MKLTLTKLPDRWRLWLVLGLAVPCLMLLTFCGWFNVWSPDAWTVYCAMDSECHPSWRYYHFGHVQAGDSVEDVIALTKPTSIDRTGRWVYLIYSKHPGKGLEFTGVSASAYDGKMVDALAVSCCWIREFFDVKTKEQNKELYGDEEGFRVLKGILYIR